MHPPQAKSAMSFSGWWGRHTIEPRRQDMWQIGPLKLWIQHLSHEWRIDWLQGRDWLDATVRAQPSTETPPAITDKINFVFSAGAREDVVFTPVLPDRPVISRLSTPLSVLPGETVLLYMVSPLWLRVELARNNKRVCEIPTYRLSDTWFGPMHSGELCYASTAAAFLDLSEVPLRHHCAITAVSIRNQGAGPLRLERVQVPMPKLTLFYSPRTGFWTNSVSFERREDSEMAGLQLHREPPSEASPSQAVTSPRAANGSESLAVVRAFGALFRERSLL